MIALIEAAGWPIWPLIIASIVALAIIFERLYTLRRDQIIPPSLLQQTIETLRREGADQNLLRGLAEGSPLGRVLAAGVRNLSSSREVMKESLEEAGRAVAHHAYGIRTSLSLRTHGMEEEESDLTPPYPDLRTVKAAIEDFTDMEFAQKWAGSGLWCTPLYYRHALQRWPERHAAAMTAIARAQPGGVLVHCRRGNDRTGIITLLLLRWPALQRRRSLQIMS